MSHEEIAITLSKLYSIEKDPKQSHTSLFLTPNHPTLATNRTSLTQLALRAAAQQLLTDEGMQEVPDHLKDAFFHQVPVDFPLEKIIHFESNIYWIRRFAHDFPRRNIRDIDPAGSLTARQKYLECVLTDEVSKIKTPTDAENEVELCSSAITKSFEEFSALVSPFVLRLVLRFSTRVDMSALLKLFPHTTELDLKYNTTHVDVKRFVDPAPAMLSLDAVPPSLGVLGPPTPEPDTGQDPKSDEDPPPDPSTLQPVMAEPAPLRRGVQQAAHVSATTRWGVSLADCVLMARGLQFFHRPLEAVRLTHSMLGPDHLACLAVGIKAGKGIRVLDLGFNQLTDTAAVTLSKLLSPRTCSIRVLVLTANRIGARGAALLARPLGMRGCPLEELWLGGNSIGDEGASALLAGILRGALKYQSATMRALHLPACALGPVTSRLLGRVVKRTAVSFLDVSGNQLGESEGRWLVHAAEERAKAGSPVEVVCDGCGLSLKQMARLTKAGTSNEDLK
eukprot:gnl/Dysnectes_brevis/2663_a3220_736.p1 GENE.gnl/Dysnectes_brevis/2663_a3220_736~~gnl/Dysnectes_brevis/2663_a3220_736.p1  ORF type:complete len:507 (+),score=124.84 gnl/Dysnectes_brevis/2663_a3220_736:35-1555(+)